MLFAALTFWLFIVAYAALGVHTLWSGMIKPRVVNGVLLPGTLVAQLGHVLGLLITGNSVQNTKLMGDDEDGAPTNEQPQQQKIPIIGPILVGLLPLVACAVCFYLAAHFLGGSVLREFAATQAVLPRTLPMSLSAAWDYPRAAVTLAQSALNAVLRSDLRDWATIAFLYLAVCLTVRMAPFDGHRRGAVGAILLAGVVIGVVGQFVPAARQFVETSWQTLSFVVASLMFLLVVSLLIRGVVGLVRSLVRNE